MRYGEVILLFSSSCFLASRTVEATTVLKLVRVADTAASVAVAGECWGLFPAQAVWFPAPAAVT